eukprot:jgi/Tetstr1/436040/TSEL_024919.t1
MSAATFLRRASGAVLRAALVAPTCARATSGLSGTPSSFAATPIVSPSRGFGAEAGLSQKTIGIVKATAPVMAEHGYAITKAMYGRMLTNNPSVSELFNKTHQVEMGGEKAFQPNALACSVHAYAAHIDDLGALTEAVERIAQKHVSLMVTEEQYGIVGENLLWAVKEVLGDAATPDIMDAWAEAYGFLANIFIAREKQLYTEFASSPNGWSGWKEMKVTKKAIENYGLMSVDLKPADGSGVPSFMPGQYIGVRAEVPGHGIVQRNYSLSIAPGGDNLRITVKRERPADKDAPFGVMSYYIHDRLFEGDSILVSQPAGDFFYRMDSSKRPLVLMAGGIGMTPILSILEYAVQSKLDRHITVFAAIRSNKMEPYSEQLQRISASNLNINVNLVYDEPPKPWNTQGPLSINHLKQALVTKDCDYYFCGPPGFMKNMATSLRDWGVPSDQLKYEYFGPHEG